MSEGSSGTGGCCKVGRVSERYGLAELDAELGDRWGGPDGDSLRDLETYVNTALVRAAVGAAGESLVDGEAGNYYRLLAGDDVSEGNRIEARRRLQRQGVDVDALVDSFVSHQTIHTHLRTCLGVARERDTDPEQRAEDTRRYLQHLQARTERVATDSLAGLRDAGIHDMGQFSVYVDLMVSCEECGRVMSVADLFENDGCECHQ